MVMLGMALEWKWVILSGIFLLDCKIDSNKLDTISIKLNVEYCAMSIFIIKKKKRKKKEGGKRAYSLFLSIF